MPNNEYFIEEPKRSFKRIISLILALAIVVLLTVGAYFYTKVNQAASSESAPVDFTVSKGLSTQEIGKRLTDDNIINSYWAFIFYTKFYNAAGKIQAGTYILNPNMSIAEIVEVLTAGKVVSNSRKVTIIEGQTNKQIAADLESRNIVTAKDFNSALSTGVFSFNYLDLAEDLNFQGFLFPDTYQVSKDATAEQLIQKMLINFESKITPQMQLEMNAKNRTLEEVLILASIVEKEVGRNKEKITADDLVTMQQERKLVASVFYNRLGIGMALESDATVNFVTGKSDRSATIADTKIKSPYNTYQVKGLPPGPISNPGLNSIEAAINPTASDYLFFLNSPDGTAYFAKTLAEHNANRAKYLR